MIGFHLSESFPITPLSGHKLTRQDPQQADKTHFSCPSSTPRRAGLATSLQKGNTNEFQHPQIQGPTQYELERAESETTANTDGFSW